MISGLMNPDTQQPGNAGNEGGAPRSPDMYDAMAWLELNKGKLGLFALLAVLIGFGVATWRYFNEQQELKASTALLELRPVLTPQTNVPPPQASALLKVAEDFSGTHAAQRAKFLAAQALYTEGKYAEAETQFGNFVRENAGSPWVPMAAYGQAAALEAMNKTNEALTAYQQIATAYANSSVMDEAKLAIARIYETRNEPQQALRIYNELLPATPEGMGMGNPEAMERKDALLRLHPELGTNQAPALGAMTAPLQGGTQAISAIPAQTNAGAPATNAPAAQD